MKTATRPAGYFALLLMVALSVSGSAWAQQREARLLPGPMSERPIILAACPAAELAKCKAGVPGKCGEDKLCTAQALDQCEVICKLQK